MADRETDIVFTPITPDLIHEIEPWFDDPETQRFLGNREWVRRTLALVRESPGMEFRGQRVLARHVWVVHEAGRAVALVDVEPYADATAGIALVVEPGVRGQGVGQRVLSSLGRLEELAEVEVLIGAIEAENIAARHCVEGAGFKVAEWEDEEGMLRIARNAP